MKKEIKLMMQSLIFIFSLLACTDRTTEIPTGNHTFSCKINGEVFLPKNTAPIGSTLPSGDGLSFVIPNNSKDIHITASNKNFYIVISLNDRSIKNNSLQLSSGNYFDFSNNHAYIVFNGIKYLSKENSGNIEITSSSVGDIKGNFQFKVYNENNPNDVLTVTEGKFDD